jgi:hypothetical protein
MTKLYPVDGIPEPPRRHIRNDSRRSGILVPGSLARYSSHPDEEFVTTEDAAVTTPQWELARKVHDWRNYVSKEIRAAWFTFTEEQRRMLFRQADEVASHEEWD